MTFVIKPTPDFLAPVTFNMPVDGGKTQAVTFSVRFKALAKSVVQDMIDRARLKPTAPIISQSADAASGGALIGEIKVSPLTDREMVDMVLVGFGDDLKEPDGSQVEFTSEAVNRLCDIYGVEQAIVRSYFANFVAAATKN